MLVERFIEKVIFGMGILKGVVLGLVLVWAPVLYEIALLLALGLLELFAATLHHGYFRIEQLMLYRQQQSPMTQDITSEIKYYSFIICQTEDKEIAEKWDYYILSVNGQLLMSSEEHKSKYQYNLSIDTIACSFNAHHIILGTGDWLKPCLTESEAQLLKKHKVLRYDTLWVAKSITFFYYIGVGGAFGDRFVEISPKYIHDADALIFEYESPAINYRQFTHLQATEDEEDQHQIYSFCSEYALLSDMHFLNCLVRTRKQTGSYAKQPDGTYKFWMNPHLFRVLENFYPPPRL